MLTAFSSSARRRFRRGMVWGLALSCPILSASAATYYVDFASGADTGAGTAAAPFQHSPGDGNATGKAAGAKLASGDTVIFKGGVSYLGFITCTTDGVAYDGNSAGTFGTGRAVFNGQNNSTQIYGFYADRKTGLTFNNLEMEAYGGHGSNPWTGTETSGRYGYAVYLTGCSQVTVENCYFHNIGDWQNVALANEGYMEGVGIDIIDSGTAMTITGNEFTEIGRAAIQIEPREDSQICTNISITGNNFHDFLRWGVWLSTDNTNCTLNGITIDGNSFHDIYQYATGNWLGLPNDAPHVDCIIAYVGALPPQGGQTLGTVANPVTIRNNLFYNNATVAQVQNSAVFLDTWGGRTLIYDNVFINTLYNGNGAIFCLEGTDTSINPAPDYWICNNSFYDTTYAVTLESELYPLKNGDVHILNNIFYKPDSGPGFSVRVMDANSVPTQVDYNLYSTTRSDNQLALLPSGYQTFSGLQAAGYEEHGGQSSPQYLNVTPGLGSASSSNDLHLQSDSPAIGAGLNLSALFSADKDGNSRPATTAWDAGAYEFQGVPTTPVVTTPVVTPPATPVVVPPAVTSSAATIPVVTNPGNEYSNVGTGVTFNVTATGATSFTYQWYFNGAAITGATSAEYAIQSVQTANAGQYAVAVTDSAGTTTSAAATLTVPGAVAGTTPVVTTPAVTVPVLTKPESETSNVGTGVTFDVAATATGTSTFTYQWYLNGAAISGATSPEYAIESVQTSNAGTYTVAVADSAGTATSAPAVLTVPAPVVVTPPAVATPAVTTPVLTKPESETSNVGTGVTFDVAATATGTSTFTYQWYLNGAAISGATFPEYAIESVQASNAGTYTVAVADSAGATTSAPAVLTVVPAPIAADVSSPAAATPAAASRLVNLSVRAVSASGSNVLVAGFVISGGGKSMLVRGVGPGLAALGVTGVLDDPELSIYAGDAVLASNAAWGGAIALQSAFSELGAFALNPDSKDSAILTTLPAGAYTAQISSPDGTSGAAMAELYDADGSASSSRLINVSGRAQVGGGGGNLVAGFVVSGNAPETVLIRGVGPGLAQFGVTGVLAAPQIDLYQNSTLIQHNQGWNGDPALSAAFAQVGAFALTGTADAAMIVTLPPGAYSVQVSGVGGTAGVALAEVYEVP